MKIVFVYRGFESMGIEILSSVLKKNGHVVELIYDPSIFRTFHVSHKTLHNLFDFKRILVAEVIKSRADLVCFSVVSDDYGWACSVAEQIKKEQKGLKIIFGGIHPSSVPERVIKQSFVDFVCVGEGEEALLELVSSLEKGQDITLIDNIWTKINGEIFKNKVRPLIQDLDGLPLPDKALFYQHCRGFTNRIYFVMTSRGCPYQCAYCYGSSLQQLYKGKGVFLRRRSVDNVLNELVWAKSKFKFNKIIFVDDVFTYDIEWLREFLEKYKKLIKMPFGCLIYPAAKNFSKEIIDLLESAGCKSAGMGVQSIFKTQRVDVLNRPGENKDIIETINAFSQTKIFLYADIILGIPGQDENELIETAMFFNKHKPDALATMWLRYYPNTAILEKAKEQGFLTKEQIEMNEESRFYTPIAQGGSTFNKSLGRLGNLLLLAHIIPTRMLNFIIDKKIYCFFPARNLHYLTTLLMIFRQRVFKQKDGSLYFSVIGLFEYYVFSFLGFLRRGFKIKKVKKNK